MRLISKHHDYYDSVFRNYSKDSHVFVRNRFEIPIVVKGLQHNSLPSVRYNNLHYVFHMGVIGFCGNLYPYIKVMQTEGDFATNLVVDYVYTLGDFAKTVSGYGESDLKYESFSYIGKNGFYTIVENWLENGLISRYGDDFELDNSKQLNSIFVDQKVAYFNISMECHRMKVELYPILADYKFFRVMDIFATYQSLECYLCNILVAPDKPYIAPVPDKIKAESKGFDKFSFRKEKSI